MKHLKRFFENRVWRYDEDKFLQFLYDLDEIKEKVKKISSKYEFGYNFDYFFDDTDDTLVVEFGYSAYSDGFHKTIKIFYNHSMGPTKVISTEEGNGYGADFSNQNVTEFDSFDDICKYIIDDLHGYLD